MRRKTPVQCKATTKKGTRCKVYTRRVDHLCKNHARQKTHAIPIRGESKKGSYAGYSADMYSTSEWREQRDAHLATNPSCFLCGRKDRQRTAHHKRYPANPCEDSGFLITLCHPGPCHKFVTALHKSGLVPLEKAHMKAMELFYGIYNYDYHFKLSNVEKSA